LRRDTDRGEKMFDKKKLEKAVYMMLEALGKDPDSEPLKKTPERVAEMLEEILAGTEQDPAAELTVFQADYDEIVLVKDISLYSVCEHHLLPFIGKAHVAYIPDKGRVTGLSKLVRAVHIFSRRLQVQERLTEEIAAAIMENLKPKGVMVVIEAEHLCMSMRGVKEPGTLTVTSSVKGVFRTSRATREETLALINRKP
jgi:GTP cyclohydrolase IA